MPPRMSRKTGLVWSQRSRKKPRRPPTTTVETRTNGSSMAMAAWLETSFAFSVTGEGDSEFSGLLSEGILGEPRERLRIQPGGERDKHGDAEGHSLRARHQRTRRFAWLLEPGVHDDAEVIVERGHDIKHGEDGEHRMVRFDQRKENEILAHETGRGRDAREREHENQKQQRRGRAALVQAVQVLEFLADEPFLAKHDDDCKCSQGHEHVSEQVV